MIFDDFAEFLDNGDASNEAGTTLLGDVMDLGAAGRDPGNGQPLYLVIQVVTAADGGAGAAGTLSFQIASDSVAAIATDGSQSIHAATKAFAASELAAGTEIILPIPPGGGGDGFERYLGLQGVQAVEGEDDLTINAFLTLNPKVSTKFADAEK